MNPIDPVLTRATEGNTNSVALEPKASSNKQYLYWCGTHHIRDDLSDLHLLEYLKKQPKYIIGNEICPSTGRQHYQFFFQSINKSGVRFSTLHKEFPYTHFEKTYSSLEANFKYCSKAGSYTTNIYLYIPKLTRDTMYPWQKQVLDLVLTMPDERSIYWFWGEGNTGKTTMAKYLSFYHDAIPLRGKSSDILHCVAEHDSMIYLFIAPRTCEDYFPYEALELVKDGYFMSGKYESKPIIRACPHVIVMANFEPNLLKLSIDRWKVIKV